MQYSVTPLAASEYDKLYAEPEIAEDANLQGKSLLQHYAETDLLNIQGVSGNTIYGVPSQCMELLNNSHLPCSEFPRKNLKFLELLGEGMFGEVSCSIFLKCFCCLTSQLDYD